MGSPALPTHRGLIMKIFIVLGFLGLVAAGPSRYYGYGPKCSKELETITVKLCRLEFEKSCTTETKVVGDKVSYEKGECKEVEVCKPVHFVPRYGHFGKRSADASYVQDCEKETKEVCKQVPVKTPVEKEIETCVSTPKEVCEDVERKVPKLVCESYKH